MPLKTIFEALLEKLSRKKKTNSNKQRKPLTKFVRRIAAKLRNLVGRELGTEAAKNAAVLLSECEELKKDSLRLQFEALPCANNRNENIATEPSAPLLARATEVEQGDLPPLTPEILASLAALQAHPTTAPSEEASSDPLEEPVIPIPPPLPAAPIAKIPAAPTLHEEPQYKEPSVYATLATKLMRKNSEETNKMAHKFVYDIPTSNPKRSLSAELMQELVLAAHIKKTRLEHVSFDDLILRKPVPIHQGRLGEALLDQVNQLIPIPVEPAKASADERDPDWM